MHTISTNFVTEIFRLEFPYINRRLRESRSHGLKYHRDLDWIYRHLYTRHYNNVR